MHENTHQQSTKPQSLESKEKMKGLMPPAFGLEASSVEDGNTKADIKYGSEISYVDGSPAGVKGITVPSVVVPNLAIDEKDGGFEVRADMICWPEITLWPGDNALGRLLNIADENSPHITNANYLQIARELTPDAEGLTHSGRYWSRPITKHHEEVHAHEMIEEGQASFQEEVLDPLQSRDFESASDLEIEVYGYAENLKDTILHKMRDLGEEHAYKGTMHEFVALANAIIAKGKAGGYK